MDTSHSSFLKFGKDLAPLPPVGVCGVWGSEDIPGETTRFAVPSPSPSVPFSVDSSLWIGWVQNKTFGPCSSQKWHKAIIAFMSVKVQLKIKKTKVITTNIVIKQGANSPLISKNWVKQAKSLLHVFISILNSLIRKMVFTLKRTTEPCVSSGLLFTYTLWLHYNAVVVAHGKNPCYNGQRYIYTVVQNL